MSVSPTGLGRSNAASTRLDAPEGSTRILRIDKDHFGAKECSQLTSASTVFGCGVDERHANRRAESKNWIYIHQWNWGIKYGW